VQGIYAKTRYILCTFIHKSPKVMLRNQIHSEIMRQQNDIGIFMYLLQQCPLDLKSGHVFVVQNSMLRMSPFPRQVVHTILSLVKMGTVIYDLLNPQRTFPNNVFHNLYITETVSSYQ